MFQKRQLIVPVRDRRARTRILTLRNFGKAAAVSLVLLFGFRAESHWRHAQNAEYGRIVGTQIAADRELPRKPAPITVTPVEDQTAADPLLVEPAARAQALGIENPATAPVPATNTMEPVTPPAPTRTHSISDDHVAIVGDAGGVNVVQATDAQRPTLSGGIFKQQ